MNLRFSVNGVQYECEGEPEEFEAVMYSVNRLTALTSRTTNQQRQQDAPPRLMSRARIDRLHASMDIVKANNGITNMEEGLMPRMLEEVQRITAEDPTLQKLLDRLTDTASSK